MPHDMGGVYGFFTHNTPARVGVLLLLRDLERELGKDTDNGKAVPVPARVFTERLRLAYGLPRGRLQGVSAMFRVWTKRIYFERAGHDERGLPLYVLGNFGKLTLLTTEPSVEAEAMKLMRRCQSTGTLSLH